MHNGHTPDMQRTRNGHVPDRTDVERTSNGHLTRAYRIKRMNKVYGKIKGDNNNTCKSHIYSKCFSVTGFDLFFKIPSKGSVWPE